MKAEVPFEVSVGVYDTDGLTPIYDEDLVIEIGGDVTAAFVELAERVHAAAVKEAQP